MKHQDFKKPTYKLIDEFKRIRIEKNLSLNKLAELADVSRSMIGLLEKKKRVPTIITCMKIAAALEISLADLLKSIEENI